MRLKLDVSLDDAWATDALGRSQPCKSLRGALLSKIATACTVTDSGKVMDPNGNTIGTVELEP